MTATLPYIRDRDGVFQYERRVPLAVRRDDRRFQERFGGRELFRRSLRTKDRAEALAAYQAVDREFESLVACPPPVLSLTLVARAAPKRTVTNDDLAAITDRYASVTSDPFENLHRRAGVCPASAEELERLQYELEVYGEQIGAAIRSRVSNPNAFATTPVDEADKLIAEQGYHAPPGSDERGAIIGAIRAGLEQGYKRVSALAQGAIGPTLPSPVASPKTLNVLTLREGVETYIKGKKLSVKGISEVQLALRQFEEVVGRKSIAAIVREDAFKFVTALGKLTVGGKSDGSIVRKLSHGSISKRIRMLGAVISYLRDRGEYVGENHLADVKLSAHLPAVDKVIMPDKRRLQTSELNEVFKHPWFSGCASASDVYSKGNYRLNDRRFWVPIVALFTGCRAAELGGLLVSEVRLDDLHPHIVIQPNRYRTIKNNKRRCVPILDALFDLGFREYVMSIRGRGHDRLFPDWTASKRKGSAESDDPAWSNASIIRAFNRQVIPTTLKHVLSPNARREVSFHSLRGAFKAMLVAGHNISLPIANDIVGHAQDELDARYIGALSIEETYPKVKSCFYKGLMLPTSPI
ncbi:tyrosine-type recombinase/integrase [Sphingomonas sp. LR60]|uniref:DUF6538 domain-containing protein n=1 Tax=Sphingomonas sp. LR60 TaxID=3050233 RepID=UPI002FE0ADC0